MLAAARPNQRSWELPSRKLADYIEWLTVLESTAWPGDTIGERAIRRDLVDSANVSTIISCQSISPPFLKLVSHTRPVFVYHNTAAWPRAIWACEVEELDRAAVRSRLVGGRYDDAGSLWPTITVQWAAGLDADKRAELERRYRLSDDGSDGTAPQYLLRDVSPTNVLGLVRDPAVAETSGIDHLTGANTTEHGSGDGGGAREVLVTRTHCPDSGVVVIGGQDRPDGAVRADVEAPRAGWVFLSEPDYRERFAFVDGQRVALRKANLAFVAIPVPAGRHVVELRYVPTLFHRGIGITAATVAAWGGVLAFGRMRRSHLHTAT